MNRRIITNNFVWARIYQFYWNDNIWKIWSSRNFGSWCTSQSFSWIITCPTISSGITSCFDFCRQNIFHSRRARSFTIFYLHFNNIIKGIVVSFWNRISWLSIIGINIFFDRKIKSTNNYRTWVTSFCCRIVILITRLTFITIDLTSWIVNWF